MGKLGGVLGCVRHGEGETIDKFGVPVLPQPGRVGLLLKLLGHFLAQLVQRRFR